MTKPHGQLKSSMFYTMAIAASLFVPIFTLPIFTRVLSKEDFGILALSEIYAVFVAGVAFLGSSLAFDRNYFAYQDNKIKIAQLIYSILLFVFFNFFILLAATFFWGDKLSLLMFRLPGKSQILTLDLCGAFFAQVFDLFMAFYRNRKEPIMYLKFSLLNCGIYLVLTLVFLLRFHWSVPGILLAKFLAFLVVTMIIATRVHGHYPFSFSWQALRDSWKISLPTTPRVFFSIFSTRIDRYMINILGTLGGVGVYSIGQKIGYLVFAFQNALENVFQPHTYKRMFDDPEGAKKELGEYLIPFFYVAAGFALLLSMFSKEVIKILLSKTYVDVADIVIIFSTYYVVLFFSKIASYQLIYLKKTFLITVLLMVFYLINIVFNIFFIRWWGANGAAMATLTTGILSTGFAFFIAQHYYAIHWPGKKIIAIFSVYFISNLMVWSLAHSKIPYMTGFLIKIILFSIYVFLGLKFSLISSFMALRKANS